MIKRMICCLKAIPLLLRSGIWCPHVFEEVERHKGIVIAGETSFRESNDLRHSNTERVYRDATIISSKCIYCGKEDKGWFAGDGENIQIIFEVNKKE